MKVELVVFDCDGVILESVDAKSRAFARCVEGLTPDAPERLISYHLTHGGVSRQKKFEWLYREVLGREINSVEMDRLCNKFTELCYDEVLHAEFVPGAQDVLQAWVGRLPLYVASGTPQEELRAIFRDRGLTVFFRGVYGSPPGKADLLRAIASMENIDPGAMLMVGDSSTDLEAAEAVGAMFYGRGSGFRDSGHAWGEDLVGLADHLAGLA
jgi:HAD superfamily hydrolase (TIGR01549 family)